ncbi:uncharacterized protein BKCO1_830001 [Diplodia corticola]|uniref:RING-type domain-containing protein n=1 Tax=Diplodia corticola TaxID=236234 RepID=A0A1J9QKE6_9PEZI|nr:uncharacterized protein BKCO1_830001 [Diplodia corticola]OJD29342.1 hypothetical protein BKCO1_830001 [Diplodia corticola]
MHSASAVHKPLSSLLKPSTLRSEALPRPTTYELQTEMSSSPNRPNADPPPGDDTVDAGPPTAEPPPTREDTSPTLSSSPSPTLIPVPSTSIPLPPTPPPRYRTTLIRNALTHALPPLPDPSDADTAADNNEDNSNLPHCPICLNPYSDDTAALPCKHVFDRACIKEWLQENNSCPMCRAAAWEEEEEPASTAGSRRGNWTLRDRRILQDMVLALRQMQERERQRGRRGRGTVHTALLRARREGEDDDDGAAGGAGVVVGGQADQPDDGGVGDGDDGEQANQQDDGQMPQQDDDSDDDYGDDEHGDDQPPPPPPQQQYDDPSRPMAPTVPGGPHDTVIVPGMFIPAGGWRMPHWRCHMWRSPHNALSTVQVIAHRARFGPGPSDEERARAERLRARDNWLATQGRAELLLVDIERMALAMGCVDDIRIRSRRICDVVAVMLGHAAQFRGREAVPAALFMLLVTAAWTELRRQARVRRETGLRASVRNLFRRARSVREMDDVDEREFEDDGESMPEGMDVAADLARRMVNSLLLVREAVAVGHEV